MMNEWREAVRLAMFEWRASRKGLFRNIFNSVMAFFLFKFLFESGLDNSPVLMVILLFSFVISLGVAGQTKPFCLAKLSGQTQASPQLALLCMLPARHGVIVKREFVLLFLRSCPWLLTMFFLLYVLTPGRQLVSSPGAFAAFSLIWIAISIAAGSMLISLYMITTVRLQWISWALFFIFILVLVRLGETPANDLGLSLLKWITNIAEDHALQAVILSLAAAIASIFIWQAVLKRRLATIDLI